VPWNRSYSNAKPLATAHVAYELLIGTDDGNSTVVAFDILPAQ